MSPIGRQCLLRPVPQFEQAANLLDTAADAFLKGNRVVAGQLLAEANLPEIADHAYRVVGVLSQEVHRQVKRPKCMPMADRHPERMPSRTGELAIFSRDGWRGRFCGIRVISRTARSLLAREFAIGTSWTSHRKQQHSALYAMAASLDHVVPHGRGGTNEICNLVTACYCCQFGRGEWLLEEVELEDPRERPPVVDGWDGLSRLIMQRG